MSRCSVCLGYGLLRDGKVFDVFPQHEVKTLRSAADWPKGVRPCRACGGRGLR